MCTTGCNETSIVIPIGDPGANGTDGIAINGINGIEEHVVFDTVLSTYYTVQNFIDNSVDFSQFQITAYFIFPGTNNLQGISPNKAYISVSVSNTPWLVRLRDSDNLIIAESTSISGSTITIFDLGALSNLPAELDLCSIEIFPEDLTDLTGTINIQNLLLIQE